VLPLPAGLYLFSVKAAMPAPTGDHGPLTLPAMHVGLGPGVHSDQVEFLSGPSTHGAWLFSAKDLLVTRINGNGASIVLTSVRAPGGEVLSIKVERLEDRAQAVAAEAPAAARVPLKAPAAKGKASVFKGADEHLPLPVHIGAHIRSRGDMQFPNVPWAGRVAPGLWIESFSVRPPAAARASETDHAAPHQASPPRRPISRRP
jgi:hypothetical protein